MAATGSILLVVGVLVAFAAVIGLGLWISNVIHRRRVESFRLVASQNGWTYQEIAPDPSHRLAGFTPFGRGHSRTIEHLLGGTRGPLSFVCYTYIFKETKGSGKSRRTETYHYAVLECAMPIPSPGLSIEPENLGHKIVDTFGGEDIDFESDEFSRRFWVQGGDRKFAYDIVTPTMMDYLLANAAGWTWQWRGPTLVLTRKGRPHPAQAVPMVVLAQGFLERLPRHRLAAARPSRAP